MRKGSLRPMNAAQRRESILNRLSGAETPVSASALAAQLGVSRQIVVGDVDQGGIVVDVAVENSLYGELRGNLNLASRYDVDNFIQQAKNTPESLLSRMTGGVHLHTLHCPDADSFERIRQALDEKGILYRKE